MRAPYKIFMPNELLSEDWSRHIEGEDTEYIRALTWEDAQIIYMITNEVTKELEQIPLENWPEWAFGTEGRFEEVLRRFHEWRASNETR